MSAASKNSSLSVQDEGLSLYFKQIRHLPLLTFEEELALSRSIQKGDKTACQRLIEGNLRLVIKIARQYQTDGMALLDLIQEGNLGLIHAANKYDFNREVRFSTYASWWIKQAITRAIANKRRAIRLPHRKEDSLMQIRRAFSMLSQKNMCNPSLEELAAEVKMPADEVVMLMNIGMNPVSLDMELGEDDGCMFDLYQDFTYSPENLIQRQAVQDEVNDMLHQLEDRERNVLALRFALSGGKKMTLKMISEQMGVSPETVRQIEMRAMRKMKALAVDFN